MPEAYGDPEIQIAQDQQKRLYNPRTGRQSANRQGNRSATLLGTRPLILKPKNPAPPEDPPFKHENIPPNLMA